MKALAEVLTEVPHGSTVYCTNYKFAQYALAAICKIALLTEQ